MKKGQVHEGFVERVDFPNKGIVRVGEETVVVKNCLPGQKVRFGINKVRKGKAEGRLLEVLEKSPLETGRPCSLFGVCGGCTYLSLPYEEQLHVKEAQVKHLLDGVLGRQEQKWQWEGIKGSPKEYEYRNKMEFTFGDANKGGPLSLGMHKRGSFYDIVTVEDCELVDEDYRTILKAVREYFARNKVSFFHRLSHKGYLRHLLVRKASGTGEILAALVTTSQEPWESCEDGILSEKPMSGEVDQRSNVAGGCEECQQQGIPDGDWKEGNRECEVSDDCKVGNRKCEISMDVDGSEEQDVRIQELIGGFADMLLALEKEGKLSGKFAGILHITNDSMADTVQSDRTDILYGQDYFYEELLGLKFKISTFSFFQTNSYGAEVLYRTVREYVGDLGGADKTVFDLYSGTGTIAQLMAPVAGQVIGVEIVEEAVEAAKQNARDNGLTNCEFIAGDVLKVLAELTAKPDMIILDPPRDGIHPKALPRIIDYGVEKIVYISCKTTSLVRDLEVFLDSGYVVERAVAVDQFPWTANVETCCLLVRECANDDEMVSIRVDLEGIQLNQGEYKPEEKPTYGNIKKWIKEKYGFNVTNLYIGQIKDKVGLEKHLNYNIGAGEGRVPTCPQEKEEAIMEAFKHFGSI